MGIKFIWSAHIHVDFEYTLNQMSREIVIDGVSGDPMGGSRAGYGAGQTTEYAGQGGYVSGGQTYGGQSYGGQGYGTYTQGTYTHTTGGNYGTYGTSGTYASGGAVGSTYQGGHVGGSQYYEGHGSSHQPHVVNTVVNTGKEVIKGESRIEYVPFEKKIIEYKDEARVERVAKPRKIVEYREEKRIE